MNSRYGSSILVACLLAQAACESAQADGGMLDRVFVAREGDIARLEIRLACRHRYVDHLPLTRADRIRINLGGIDRCRLDAPGEPRRDLRRPPGRDLADLREVEFVQNGDFDGVLVLHFERPVAISVRQGGDLNRLIVAVDVAGNTPVADPPVTALTPQQLERAEDRARQATARAFDAPAVRGLGDFAINLESSTQPVDATTVDDALFPDRTSLYSTSVNVAGRTWHRLRLGFFASEAEADATLARLRGLFPDAWVVRVEPEEHGLAASATAVAVAPTLKGSGHGPNQQGSEQLGADQLAELAAQGRAAMIAGDNDRAVKIFTRLLNEPEHEFSQDAQEYLGLSRERNGQLAHATAEYRRYLMLYPEGAGAARVRQRLAGVTAIDELRPEPVRVADRRETPSRWDIYGGLAQYYRRDESAFDGRETVTGQSSILTDFDIAARRRGDRFDLSSRATMGNLYDLLSEDEGPGTSTRIYYLYADVVDSRYDASVRIGRQSLRSSGVLGRFDGAQASWQWRPRVRFNVQTGFPVDSTGDSLDTDRFFYGFSTDFASVLDTVDVTLFYNTQETDGFEDRRAVGGEMRYYDDARSLISLLDYDVSYGEVNSFVVLANWAFENRLTLNAMFDSRKSPLLTTRNALIGQPFTSLAELVASVGEDEVRQLAEDRTGELQTFAFGVSTPLSDRFQVNADVTLVDYTGTPETADVPAIPDVEGDIYYSMTLIGSSLLIEGDTSVFGLGYVDGSTASTASLTVDTRYPVTRALRINPRMRLSLREITRTDTDQWIAAPSLRMFYRFARRYLLELEVGGEWSSQKTDDDSFDYNSYFIYAGYRADF